MNSQSPIYSFKFTISWIAIYSVIVYFIALYLNIFISLYVGLWTVSYTHLRAHETPEHLVCRLLLEKKKHKKQKKLLHII